MNETNVNGQPDITLIKPRRFPGVSSFEDDALASELFFGREEESQKVLHYILSEHLVVIFSYSGYGKTSLLKASVFKKLREKNFYPLLVRFNKKENSPQNLIKLEIEAINENKTFEVLHVSSNGLVPVATDLASYFKGLEIWSADDKLLTPVIVFDQFEEIFTLEHNQVYVNSFFEEISNVLKDCKEGQLNIKIVISVREDFLGHLEKMAINIPTVFTNRFRLEPLKKDAAEKAIIEPAAIIINNIEFASPPFGFSQDAVKELEDFLSLKRIENSWKSSDEIEPIQLQIICSELENKIIRNEIKPGPDNHIEIKRSDLGGEAGLQKIIDDFYNQQIKTVKNELKLSNTEVYAIKDFIENGLIAGIRRVPLAYDAVVSRPGINKNAIDLLIKNKLLNLESHRGNALLELSHDTLIDPVLKAGRRSREIKAAKKRRRRVTQVFLLVCACFVSYIIYVFISDKKASQDKYYYAALLASRQNPTLGYKIALDGAGIGYTTSKLLSLLTQFENGNYAFITNSFNFQGNVLEAYVSNENTAFSILGKNKRENWYPDGSFKTYNLSEESTGYLHTADGKYFFIEFTDSLLRLRDENNKIVLTNTLKKLDIENGFHKRMSSNHSSAVKEKIVMLENLLKDFPATNDNHYNPTIHFPDITIVRMQERKCFLIGYNNAAYIHNPDNDVLYKFLPVQNQFLKLDIDYDFLESSKNEKNVQPVFVDVSNDLKCWVYSVGNDIRMMHVDVTSFIEGIIIRSEMAVEESNENVSVIKISPNDSLFLTATGNTARLWNLQGEMLGILQGHRNKIVYANFSYDGKVIITADEKGNVFTWERHTKHAGEKKLANFSPFDYTSLGLNVSRYSASELYDTSGFFNLLVAIKNYESSLPASNIYPGDITYSTSLTNSIKELKALYEAVFRSDSIKQLDDEYRNLLSKKYRTLTFAAPDKIMSKRGLDSNRIIELEKYSNVRIRNLLQGKALNKDITDVEIDLQSIIDYFVQVKNYEEVDRYYNKLIELYMGISKTASSNNPDLNKKISAAYLSLSYYNLFDGKPGTTVTSSKAALEADSSNTDAYIHMATGYLLDKKFKEAESIYARFKEKFIIDFLRDIEVLMKENIITDKDKELNDEIDKLKKLLNG